MGLTSTFAQPFFGGTAVASSGLAGQLWHVAVGGHNYLVDETQDTWRYQFNHQSIPVLRQQSDNSTQPGEHSLNPEGLWRRSQSSWHKGAGQTFLDRADSDANRFDSSKGVDIWTYWQLSLLPDTDLKRSSAATPNTNLYLMPVGSYLYLTDGRQVLYTTDITPTNPTWTALTGNPASNAESITSDGNDVYVAYGTNGIYKFTRGGASMSSYVTGTVDLVGYVRSRLMAASGHTLYNITGSGSLPTALLSHANTDFTWVGFAEGTGFIYAAGYSGDKSTVYRITITDDATTLSAPVVAGELPTGEIVRSIFGYLGFVWIGTDKGVRFAIASSTGDLTIGALIPTGNAVYAFHGQDRFTWAGWTDYDSTSTGLMRLDPSILNAPANTPAYASDLMATAQGTITSITTFQSKRVFTVAGNGTYAQSNNLVASGHLDTGKITFELPDRKTALYVDVRHEQLPSGASVLTYLATDDGTFTLIGTDTNTSASGALNPANQANGEAFEIRMTLTRGATTTVGPTVTRETLLVNPATDSGVTIQVPVILARNVMALNGATYYMDVSGEYQFLTGLRKTRELVTYQQAADSWTVWVEDFVFIPQKMTADGTTFDGTFVLRLRTL